MLVLDASRGLVVGGVDVDAYNELCSTSLHSAATPARLTAGALTDGLRPASAMDFCAELLAELALLADSRAAAVGQRAAMLQALVYGS